MRRKKKNANKSSNLQGLPLVHPNAAGIDVGAKEHVAAVPCDRDPKPVRTFQAFTPDLHELAAWLKRCGIETVALESTGIYWISLYEVLEQYGFEIRVVNARHVKHVPGRTKTDVLDCQWIQKHSFGLLNGTETHQRFQRWSPARSRRQFYMGKHGTKTQETSTPMSM
jgi:transposase